MTDHDDGFRYLSPWLPMREGWYCIAHVGGLLVRWRLQQRHERNRTTGERWVQWYLWQDQSVIEPLANAAGHWTNLKEMPSAIRDRAHAGQLVEAMFAELCAARAKGAPCER